MRDVGVELSPVVRSQRGDELGTSISTRENVPTLVPSKVLVDPDDDGLSPDTPQAAEIMYRIAQLETAVRGLQAASMPQEAPAERVEKLENFYSYCVEELVFSKSSARRLKFSLLIILVACAQWCAGKFRISDLTRMPRGTSLVFAVHPSFVDRHPSAASQVLGSMMRRGSASIRATQIYSAGLCQRPVSTRTTPSQTRSRGTPCRQ